MVFKWYNFTGVQNGLREPSKKPYSILRHTVVSSFFPGIFKSMLAPVGRTQPRKT